jgi:hypothetical protein
MGTIFLESSTDIPVCGLEFDLRDLLQSGIVGIGIDALE